MSERQLRTKPEYIENSRLRLILALSPAVIYTCRPDGDYGATYISENIRPQLGYEPSDFTDDPGFWASKIHPEDRARVFEEMSSLFQTGRHAHEYRFQRKDGVYRWMRDELRLLKDSNDEPVEIIGSWLDITDRKEMEEALRNSQAHLETAQRIAHLGSWDWNILTNDLFWSDEVCRIFGLDPQKFDNSYETFLARIHPEDRSMVEDAVQRTLTEKSPYIIEHRLMHPDGRVRYVLEQGQVIFGDGGEPVRMIGTVFDITERKEAERERKNLEAYVRKLQKRQAIATLAGGIAHDINNILWPIMGYTEMAINGLPENSMIRDDLNKVLKAGNRATELVRHLLTFSRETEQNRKPLRVQYIIKEVLKLLRATIPSTIKIKSKVDKSCPPVLADATQIHQILMNLCTNAYHAMGERGGQMTVDLVKVKLDSRNMSQSLSLEPGHYLLLSVCDTGCGMNRETMERIFDPYFTTKPQDKGTGLGLAVTHGIVQSHGGDIQVSSEIGKGTEFHVYLPQIEEEGVTPMKGLAMNIRRGSERILLVDDEPEIVEMVKRMLKELGYVVFTRTSSMEALEAFRADPDRFDLVITDMTMPNMTGMELSRKLMELRPDIPIILCTGFSEGLNEKKALSSGIKEFVMKPVLAKDITYAIEKALSKSRANLKPS